MAEPVSRLSAVLVTPRPATRTPAPAVTKRYVPPPPPEPFPAGVGARVKAGADFVLAAGMAVVLLPVLLGCMALVRLTSNGPAIYTQARMGRGGRVFTLYKIRTMFNDCESLTGSGDPALRIAFWSGDSITNINLHQIDIATDLRMDRRRAEGFDLSRLDGLLRKRFADWFRRRNFRQRGR